jgi:transposase
MIDALDRQLAPLERDIRALARRQAGCRELMRHYGIGPVTPTSIVAELGDVSRRSASRKAVRCSGVGVLALRRSESRGGARSDRASLLRRVVRRLSVRIRMLAQERASAASRLDTRGAPRTSAWQNG